MNPHPGLAGRPVYFDYNATTPVDPAVVEAMLPYLGVTFGNPSSSHTFGTAARTAVDAARHQVSDLVGGQQGRIVFTGSGSEADALAITGTVLSRRAPGRRAWAILGPASRTRNPESAPMVLGLTGLARRLLTCLRALSSGS